MMSPQELYHWIVESIRRLFTTPIAAWTWGQVLLACILFSLVSSCLRRCLCCGRRRGRRRYYYRNNNNETEADGVYHAYNNHPFGMGQNSIQMQQDPRQAYGSRPKDSRQQTDPPALVPYHQV